MTNDCIGITPDEAAEIDPFCKITCNTVVGSLMLLKVCGFDRIGMIRSFYTNKARDRVDVKFLMIDTLLANMDGYRAWGTFSSECIQRKATAFDLPCLMTTLAFPPKEELGEDKEELGEDGA